jgi:hypothetical protein
MQTNGLLDVVNNQIDARSHEQHTNYLARVIRVVSAETLTVDVEMLSLRYDDDGETQDDAPILGVPLYMPSSSTSGITYPVSVGDTVLCIVSETDITNYKIANSQTDVPIRALTNLRFDAQNAIAIPYDKRSNKSATRTLAHDVKDLSIVHNRGTALECRVLFKADGNLEVESPFTVTVKAQDINLEAANSISLTAQTMTINVPNTTWTGNYALAGEATFNGIPFSTHKHTGVTAGAATSGGPTA